MAKQLNPKEAKERIGRFCAFRERSPNEVLQKLKSWGLSDQEGEALIAELTELKFIDETRFANAFCNDKFEFNSWGKQKIRAHIFAHRIPASIVDEALARIDEDRYTNRLHALAKTKWDKHAGEEEMKQKQKTVNHLTAKGFELDLIWKSIARLEKDKGH